MTQLFVKFVLLASGDDDVFWTETGDNNCDDFIDAPKRRRMALLSQSKGFRSPSPESGAGTIEQCKPNCDAEQNEESEQEQEEDKHNAEFECTDLHVSFLENESGYSSEFSWDSRLSDWKSVFTHLLQA